MFSNLHARPITSKDGVCEELALNMAHPVRWHDIMSAMEGIGINFALESPPGRTLAGLAAESLPNVQMFSAAETRWDVLLLAAKRVKPA
jgi:malonate decarboxylase epsilon subunit